MNAGGLFSPLPSSGGDDHQITDPQEIAFKYAVEKINADNKILPRSKLYAEIERILPQDSFHASKRVCHLMKTGVAAIFGPQSSHTASHVQSICDTMEVSERRLNFSRS
jgi:ionotropic kainate glutamate receptor 2